MHPQLTKAIEIVDKLQEWLDGILEGHEIDADTNLYAGFAYSANDVIGITIGEVELWNNQACSDESLTFEACRESFLEHIEQYVPFLAVEREGS